MTVDPTKLDEILGVIKKKHGDSAVRTGDKYDEVPRISTGSLEMDYMMQGGFPIGRISRLFGAYSAGKSLTCWSLIREAQAQGLTCAYYDIEKQYDPKFTASQGVDISKLQLVEGQVIEKVGERLEALLGVVHVHILDSLSSAVSVDELDTKLEEWRVGLKPRAWGKVLGRVLNYMDAGPEGNVIVLVDQARDTFGAANAIEHPPGGRFIEHSSSMSLHMKRGAFCWYDANGILQSDMNSKQVTASDLKQADGYEIQGTVYKSRVSRPRLTCRIRLDYKTMRFDQIYEIQKLGCHFGVIRRDSGNWWTMPNGKRCNGKNQVYMALKEDPDLQRTVSSMIRMVWH